MTRRRKNESYYFVVEGSGLFPFDMLRYDRCFPAREAEDSSKMGAYESLGRRIMLTTEYDFAPKDARWESFNWKVVDQDTDRAELIARVAMLPALPVRK